MICITSRQETVRPATTAYSKVVPKMKLLQTVAGVFCVTNECCLENALHAWVFPASVPRIEDLIWAGGSLPLIGKEAMAIQGSRKMVGPECQLQAFHSIKAEANSLLFRL